MEQNKYLQRYIIKIIIFLKIPEIKEVPNLHIERIPYALENDSEFIWM